MDKKKIDDFWETFADPVLVIHIFKNVILPCLAILAIAYGFYYVFA